MLKKLFVIATSAIMAVAGLIAMPQQAAPALAAPGASAFDPGLIISDSVFLILARWMLQEFSSS